MADRPLDISKPTLFVVGYAHLDTQYRWSYPQVIREFIPDTLRKNFEMLERHPHYVINFSGARRYQWMKDFYPAEYEELKRWIATGRWFPCGASVDEADTLVPSPESLIRHILLGNRFFRREYGIASNEFMLPDCFGFTAALPSILAHCGIRGFSTAKLAWGSAIGTPFPIGVWLGPDGRGVIAAFDPGAYDKGLSEDLSQSERWLERIEKTGKTCGAFVDYHYYGPVGDRGGAATEESIAWLDKSVAGAGPIRVISSTAGQMFNAITDDQRSRLPRYQGELLLTEHSAGSITSQSAMKRWNRKNELFADAAERTAIIADWLGGLSYPADQLREAWMLVLGSQMHDMLPGTSLPKAYEYCWNDELLAANQFAAVLESSVGGIAAAMDTNVAGVPLVVCNPLSIEREDLVEATVRFPESAPSNVAVFDPDGKRVPSQVLDRTEHEIRILFVAKCPSIGFTVYEVRATDLPLPRYSAGEGQGEGLAAGEWRLENTDLRVTLTSEGDIASIIDKQHQREILAAPIRLAFLHEKPEKYPAWNMDWSDRQKPPRAYVTGPAKMRIIEHGPVRVAIQVEREAEGSRFIQRISLSADSDRVEIATTIDWRTRESSLKAVFPFTAANSVATYDLQLGTIQRGNNDPKKYEVPSHQWIDLTDAGGEFGVALLNDCKYGSDKADDRTIRLTLLYTPGVREKTQDQATQDFGRHQMLYAVMPHPGDWRRGWVPWAAARLTQPLTAFQCDPHAGALGRRFSFLSLNTDHVAVMAVKKAEESGEIIVRLREMRGARAEGARLRFASPIVSAREVNGQELPAGPARLDDGCLLFDLEPYSLSAFALTLTSSSVRVAPPLYQSIDLLCDADVAAEGFPIERLPETVLHAGVPFAIGSRWATKQALSCRGQTIVLPAGFDRLYILATAGDRDERIAFRIGDRETRLIVHSWCGYLGQWDNRIWNEPVPELAYTWENKLVGIEPGYLKRAKVAWFCPYRRDSSGEILYYQYSYVFKYAFDLRAKEAASLVLPDSPGIRIFAATVARGAHDDVWAAGPLFDTLDDRSR